MPSAHIFFFPIHKFIFNFFWKFLNRTTAIFIIFVIESKLECNNFTTIITDEPVWQTNKKMSGAQHRNRRTDSRLKRQTFCKNEEQKYCSKRSNEIYCNNDSHCTRCLNFIFYSDRLSAPGFFLYFKMTVISLKLHTVFVSRP